MTISKFSAASVTATIFMAAFSTSTVAVPSIGTDSITESVTVKITQPGVTGHTLTEVDNLTTSITDGTTIATGAVTTSVENGDIGLHWTTGAYISGQDYAYRSITREGGAEKIRVKVTSLAGSLLGVGNRQDTAMKITANGSDAGYLIKFSTIGGVTPVTAGDYVIGMRAGTYIP